MYRRYYLMPGTAQNRYSAVLLDTLADASELELPTLFPETQVSRQYAFHVLQLPGAPEPTWHRYLAQAFETAVDAGYDSLTLCIADTQYHVSLIQ